MANKCQRENCIYEKHTDIKNNNGTHCCKYCKNNKDHGPLCQRIINGVTRATNIPNRCKSITPPFSLLPILLGETKKTFEIVIARYDEDISWSNNYKSFRTVYNKGDNHSDYDYIKLENKGHLADTILRHIINNYDKLADVTFFSHGSYNYRPDQIIKESHPCSKLWRNFITTDKKALIYIERKDLISRTTKFYNYKDTIGVVYERIFNRTYKQIEKWSIGKIMSVGSEVIRKSPIELYKRMLDFVLEPYEGKEPSQHLYRLRGIYIERLILQAFIR